MRKITSAFAKMWHNAKAKKTRTITVLVILILVFGIGVFNIAYAIDVSQVFAQIFALIFYGVAWLLGYIAMHLFALVIAVAGFQDFVDNEGVITGWTVIRDVCNMFFVVILLIIAFATILRVEKYSIKSLLPKVIFAAVAINFSRLITGLIIDFAQVVMLTFVNGFQASAGANLINGLGVDKFMSISPEARQTPTEINFWDIALALAMAAIMFLFTLVVVIIMLVILTIRIVFIWILVILSPFAFVGMLLPFTQGLAKQWWSMFGKWVAIGPILAFFLWLSLLMMQSEGGVSTDTAKVTQSAQKKSGVTGQALTPGAMNEGSSLPNMAQFAVGIALMYGSTIITQKMGGQVGGKVAGKISKAAKGAAFKYTGAQAVTERYDAAKGVLEQRRQAKISEFGSKVGRGYERVTAAPRAALGAAAAAPIAAIPRLVTGLGRAIGRGREIKQGIGGAKGVVAGIAGGVGEYLSRALGAKDLTSRIRTESTRAKGASNEAAKGKVSEHLSQLKSARFDPEKSRKRMKSADTKEERVAHFINASKAGKLKEEDMPAAKQLLKNVSGTGLESVVKDELLPKFAHRLYDPNVPEGRQALMNLHDKGDIDLTKLDASAYESREFLSIISEKFGENADDLFKKVYKRGGKAQENLVKGIDGMKNMRMKSDAVKELARIREKPENKRTKKEKTELIKMEIVEKAMEKDYSKLHAKLSSKPAEAYGNDIEGLKKYFTDMTGTKDLQKMPITKDKQLAKVTDAQKVAISQGVSTDQLSNLVKTGYGDIARAITQGKIDAVQSSDVSNDDKIKIVKELEVITNNNTIIQSRPDVSSAAEDSWAENATRYQQT